MVIKDLSLRGLRFKPLRPWTFKEGELTTVEFNLDDLKQSLIRKKVIVRRVFSG